MWGREVTHLELDTTVGPTWKPLFILLTAPLSVWTSAAPTLTLLVIRAAWLLSFVLAYRIGTRLGGRAAGVIGAAGLVLLPDSAAEGARYFIEGRAEPLVAALVLAAIDRHLAGQRMLALGLGSLAALGRPEAWPLAVAYGLVVWRSVAGHRWLVPAMLAAVPLLWVGGGLWGAGDPLDAVGSARSKVERGRARPMPVTPKRIVSVDPWGSTLSRIAGLTIPAYFLAALVALTRAAAHSWRRADEPARVILGLGVGALAWIVGDLVVGLMGLPLLTRFMLPAAAVISILAGVGFVQAVQAIGDRRARALAAVVLAGVTIALAAPRLAAVWEHVEPNTGERAESQSLREALERSRARQVLVRCGGKVRVIHGGKNEVTWLLGVPLRTARDHRRTPRQASRGIAVVRSVDEPERPRPRRNRRRPSGDELPSDRRLLARVGVWSVYEFGCPSRAA